MRLAPLQESSKGKTDNPVDLKNLRYVYSSVTSFSNIVLEFIRRNFVIVFSKSIVDNGLLCFCLLSRPQLAVGKFSRVKGQAVYEARNS